MEHKKSHRPNLYVVCEDAYDAPLCKDELAMRLVRGERVFIEPVGELVYDNDEHGSLRVIVDTEFFGCVTTHQRAADKSATSQAQKLAECDASDIPAELLAPQCMDIDGKQPYRLESFHRSFRLQEYPDAVYLTNSQGYNPQLPADWWDCLAEERNMREKFLDATTEPSLDDTELGCAGELANLYTMGHEAQAAWDAKEAARNRGYGPRHE